MNRRDRRLADKGRKSGATRGATAPAKRAEPQHIHCVACGRHLDPAFFNAPAKATVVRCAHGSTFAACNECATKAQLMLDEHDRSGQPVKPAAAWH